MLYNAALVLEGGALRGQYSAGVVDTFLAHHIEFQSVIGVSAGALCGANFVSKQYGRVTSINTGYRHNSDYISIRHLLRKKSIIDLDYLFKDHGLQWSNFDERAYHRSATNFSIVATSLATGQAAVFTNPGGKDLQDALIASSSMPFMAEPRQTTQGLCLDGGVADSIPVDIAQKQGFDKIVVVRTRDINYRKKKTSSAVAKMYQHLYRQYPEFIQAGINRPEMYNHQVVTINKMHQRGELFCIAPQTPVTIKRLEGNVKKLDALYEQGQREAHRILPHLITYLEN